MERNIEPIQSPAYTMPLLWRLRLWALRRQHWQACRQATRILAVSNYVREQLQINFSIEEEKIDIVYHGFDMRETKMERRPKIPLPEEPFIFGAGSLIPYRGYEDIIRTVALLKRQGESCPPVVLAGVPDGPARAYARWIRQLPATLGVSKQITWANQLSQAEMTWCYRHARMFVQTSRAEACPNILLEALGHGCIVVSCTQQPMPEIQGESAIFYRTGDATELAPRILQVCAMSRDDAQAMQEKARQRARLFSWDKTAECTLDVLERAISSFNCVRGSHPTARSERHKLHPLHVV
jgi:glycosyltransferase involved in cell wall biosynthesis